MGEILNASDASPEVLRFLSVRRSAGKANLKAPGPGEAELREVLRIAARVPDHRRVEPWRFITLLGDARHQFGDKLAEIAATSEVARSRDVSPETSAALPLRAPVIVAVVSSVRREYIVHPPIGSATARLVYD